MINEILAIATKTLDLDKEAGAITALIDAIAQHTPETLSPLARFDALVALLAGPAAPPGMPASVVSALKAYADARNRLRERGVGVLLQPYGAFADGTLAPAVAHWPIINGKGTTNAGAVALSLAADASLSLAVNTGTNLWTFSDPPAGHLLAIGLKAGASAAASADMPFRALRFGVDAAAGMTVAIDWFLAPAGPQRALPVGVLAAQALPRLANPMQLASVLEQMNAAGLVGLRLKASGETSLSGSLTIGFAEDLGSGVPVTGAAEIKFMSSLKADYELTLKAVPGDMPGERDLQIKVNRNRLNAVEAAMGLGVEVDLSALTARFRALLVARVGLLRDGLEQLRPWLSPGRKALGLLDAQLTTLVDQLLAADPGLKAAVIQEIDALTGASDPGALTGHLKAMLAGLLDRGGVLGSEASASLAAAISKRLPAPLRGLAGQIQAALPGLIDQYRSRLDAALTQIAGGATAPVDAVLAEAGTAITAAANGLDQRLAGLRTLLARVDTLAARIAAVSEDTLRQQVKLQIAMAESRWDGQGLQLSGQFSALTPEAAAVYSSITRGHFQSLASLFAGDAVPGFTLDRAASRLSLTAGRQRQTSVHAVVFGFGLGFTASDLAVADVAIDGFGNILVGTKAQIAKQADMFGLRKQVSMANLVQVAVAAGGAAQVESADLGFAASVTDRTLRRREVRRMAEQLMPLATRDPTPELEQLMDRWFSGRGDKASMDGSIAIRMQFSRASLLALRDLGERQYRQPADRIAIIDRAYAITRNQNRGRRWKHDDALAVMRAHGGGRSETSPARIWLNFAASQHLVSLNEIQAWQGSPIDPAFSSLSGARLDQGDFVRVASALFRAVLISDLLDIIWRAIDWARAATPATLQQTLHHVLDEQKRLTDVANRLLRVNDTVSDWFDVSVSDWVIVLLLTLRDLLPATGEAAPTLNLVLQPADTRQGEAAIALLVPPATADGGSADDD